MLTLAGVIGLGMFVLLVFEQARKRMRISREVARKMYHVVHAVIVGVAAFLVSYNVIIVLELGLLVVMLLAHKYAWFKWLYRVGQVSWGEYFGVAGVVLIALLNPNKWVFLAALLHLGIADALAAVVGRRYGKSNQFKVFGYAKSVAGSAAFYGASVAITGLVVVLSQSSAGVAALLLLPPVMTLAEMVSPYGSDNFVIPVLVMAVLNGLKFAA